MIGPAAFTCDVGIVFLADEDKEGEIAILWNKLLPRIIFGARTGEVPEEIAHRITLRSVEIQRKRANTTLTGAERHKLATDFFKWADEQLMVN